MYELQLIDVNNDELMDIVAWQKETTTTPNALIWCENKGEHKYEKHTIGTELDFHYKLVDFNGDDQKDLIVRAGDKKNYLNSGSGSLIGPNLLKSIESSLFSPTASVLNVSNLDADNANEILLFSHKSLLLEPEIIEFDNLNFENHLTGMVYWDFNENAILDEGELGIANQLLEVTPQSLTTSSNQSGFFIFDLNSGSYSLSLQENTLWESTTNASYELEITEENISPHIAFGVKATRTIYKVEPHLTSTPSRCNTESIFWRHPPLHRPLPKHRKRCSF